MQEINVQETGAQETGAQETSVVMRSRITACLSGMHICQEGMATEEWQLKYGN